MLIILVRLSEIYFPFHIIKHMFLKSHHLRFHFLPDRLSVLLHLESQNTMDYSTTRQLVLIILGKGPSR